MITIIAGTRTINNYRLLKHEITKAEKDGIEITEVVSGGCMGVDELGEKYARVMEIPLHVFHAEWRTRGKAAGPIRNSQMVEFADALIAIWDGKSPGTRNIIKQARAAGLKIHMAVQE